jgi:hypothetical protein
MGSGLMVTLVPLADLDRVLGSGDERIVRDAARTEPDPAIVHAIGRIVDGKATDPAHAADYGYALQRICDALGESLANSAFYPSSNAALRAFDTELRARGSTFSVAALAFGRPPIALPQPDDFPFIGAIGPEALASTAELDLAAAPAEGAVGWREVGGWIAKAHARIAEDPDGRWALVGFYY